MPQAYVLNSGFFTGAGAGTGIVTPMTGDTFNIANFVNGGCYLEEIWAESALADFVSVKSPRMHDNNQGIRLRTLANTIDPLLPYEIEQPMYSGDTPVVSIDLTGAGTGAIATVTWYDDLPGAAPRLALWSDISSRVRNISGVDVALGAVGAIGAYSAGNAINSLFDNFQANADYALLGYETASSVLAIAVAGQDTSNLKVGGPGVADPKVTRDFFLKMEGGTGKPFIPIIAANNKGSTLVYQTDNSAHAAQNVTLILAELA
jgi:hypothetical protein